MAAVNTLMRRLKQRYLGQEGRRREGAAARDRSDEPTGLDVKALAS